MEKLYNLLQTQIQGGAGVYPQCTLQPTHLHSITQSGYLFSTGLSGCTHPEYIRTIQIFEQLSQHPDESSQSCWDSQRINVSKSKVIALSRPRGEEDGPSPLL